MKLLKRFGAAIFAFVVLAAGVCALGIFETTAYAEESGTVTKLIEGITFDDLTLNSTYGSEGKIYTKDGGATCDITLKKDTNSAATVSGTAENKYLTIGSGTAATELWVSGLGNHTLGSNETYVLSFKYLSTVNTLTLSMRFDGSIKAPVDLCALNTSLTKIGSASLSGKSLGTANKWHTIKIVITAGNKDANDETLNTADKVKIYCDENLLAENDWSYTYTTATSTITYAPPYVVNPLQRIVFRSKSASIDNLKFTSYKDGAVYTPASPVLVSKNSRRTGYANGNIYAGNKTVGQVIADTNIAADTDNVASYSVVNASDGVVDNSALAAGNTLKITTVEDTVISVPILGNVKKEGVTVPTSSNISYMSSTEVDGIYGKATDDKVWKLSPADLDTIPTTKTPEVRLNSVAGSVPSVTRMSILGKMDASFSICGRIVYKDESGNDVVSGGHNLIRFRNGIVLINDATGSNTVVNKQICTYKDDEWISVEIALFPGESEYLVRVNGGEWHTGQLGANGTLWKTYSSNGYVQVQIARTAPCDVYIDDLDFYTGIPSDTFSAPEVTSVVGPLTKKGRAIYGPYNREISLFVDDISVSSGAQIRFINSNGSLVSNGIYNDKKMVLENNCIYTYYDLYSRSNAFTSIENTETGVKYWADFKDGISGTPVVFSTIYQKDDNGAQSLKSVEKLDYIWKEDGVTIEFIVPDTDEQNRKIMIWNEDTLTPMTQSFGMLPSTIYLVSDSICKTYTEDQRPLAGWGEYIGYCFADAGIVVSNRAEGGRSTKSFRAEGRWDGEYSSGGRMLPGIMSTLKPDDYVFISLGHNDGNKNNEEIYTTLAEYKANLAQYIDEARAVGAEVILITPPTDAWTGNNALLTRSTAMKEVAADKNVTLLDLNARSWEHFNAIGFENAKSKYFCTVEKFEALGKTPTNENGDLTHFDATGARYLAKTIATLLKESDDLLANAVNPDAITVD